MITLFFIKYWKAKYAKVLLEARLLSKLDTATEFFDPEAAKQVLEFAKNIGSLENEDLVNAIVDRVKPEDNK